MDAYLGRIGQGVYMPFEITRDFRFEAAHLLPNVAKDHKCARLHGHSFAVTVVVGGELDPELGWVLDFADVQKAWVPLHEALDHRYLNDVEGLSNPTSEILAQWIYKRLKLPSGHVQSVTVHETCHASATFTP